MKHSLIEAGGIYRLQTGRDHNLDYIWGAHRCIILDAEKRWYNAGKGHLWISASGEWEPGHWRLTDRPIRYRWNENTARMAVAVEFTRQRTSEVDPVTGEPWDPEDPDLEKDYQHRAGYKTIELPSLWVPYAALTREIIEPWDITAERIKAEREQQRLSRRAARAREQRQEEDRLRRQAEYEEQSKQYKKRRAITLEEWDQRIQPVLIEAGLNVRFDVNGNGEGGKASFELDDLRKLAKLIQEGKLSAADLAEQW